MISLIQSTAPTSTTSQTISCADTQRFKKSTTVALPTVRESKMGAEEYDRVPYKESSSSLSKLKTIQGRNIARTFLTHLTPISLTEGPKHSSGSKFSGMEKSKSQQSDAQHEKLKATTYNANLLSDEKMQGFILNDETSLLSERVYQLQFLLVKSVKVILIL